jgi:dsRNA-specific ribonuclease
MTDSGELTEAYQSFHNENTLTKLAKNLYIDKIMKAEFEASEILTKDLKESVESLLGASYHVNGLDVCRGIVENLLKICIKEKYLTPNPKGLLQVTFQKLNLPLPIYDTTRVGGLDHHQQFQCTLTGNYMSHSFLIKSDIFSSKKEAEKDAAEKFLKEIGEEEKLYNAFFD